MKFAEKDLLNRQLKALHGVFRPKGMELTRFKDELACKWGEKNYSSFCRKFAGKNFDFILYDHVQVLSEFLDVKPEDIFQVMSECDVDQEFFVRLLKVLKKRFRPDANFKNLKDEIIRKMGFESFSEFASGVILGKGRNVKLVQRPLLMLAYARMLEEMLGVTASEIQDVVDRFVYVRDDFSNFVVVQSGSKAPVVFREDRFWELNEKFIVGLEGKVLPPSLRVLMFLAPKELTDENVKEVFEFNRKEPGNIARQFGIMNNGGNLYSPASLPGHGTFDCSGSEKECVYQVRDPAKLVIGRFEKIFTDENGVFAEEIMPFHAYVYEDTRIRFACYYPEEIEVFSALVD